MGFSWLFRARLKNVKTPEWQIFFRWTAKKSLAFGHSAIDQTSPKHSIVIAILRLLRLEQELRQGFGEGGVNRGGRYQAAVILR